jgi:serine/threonine-protein kinase
MGAGDSPQVVGRYAIYGKIASGGMASVHFGRLIGGAGFSRTVAIKRLHPHLAEDPDFLSTMIDEARLAARIHHPNVVPTLDVVAAEGELLLVMEYVRGESLARLVRIEAARNQRVPLPIASAVVIGALHGLHAAHEATSDHGAPLGIVHRDVSPQNILVGVDGLARVIDFGIAKAAGRLQTTQEGQIKGKIAYMAPEQVASRPVARTADVYAMGVVLWEVLAGTRLFPGDSQAAVVAKVLAGATEPPSRHAPNLSAGLDALVMRALARNPVDRFATAMDMAETLMRTVPPAFPTDVGKWCQQAARESIDKRGELLAEIESHSGMGVGPLPAGGPALTKEERGEAARALIRGADGHPPPPSAKPDEGQDADAPTIASQSSSLSMETPTPNSIPRRRSRRAKLVATLGAAMAAVLAMVAVAVWSTRKTPTGPEAAGSMTLPAPASTPSTLPQAAASTSATAALPTTAEAPAIAPPVAPTSPRPLPPSPQAATTPRAPSPTTPAPTPKSKPNCTPPYVLDPAGHRQYKPECL